LDWVFEGLKLHGPWAVVAMLTFYLGRKHVEEDKQARERIDALERNTVSKADLQRLEDKFESHAGEMRDGQREILTILANGKK
jgi:hypothetical protein